MDATHTDQRAKRANVYIGLALAGSTAIGVLIGAGWRAGQFMTQFEQVVQDVGAIKVDIGTMTKMAYDDRDRLTRNEERLKALVAERENEQARRREPWERSARTGRQFGGISVD
jgi:hypothetical protein